MCGPQTHFLHILDHRTHLVESKMRLYLEIQNIWCPGAGLAGTRDCMAQIRDIPGNPGQVATLTNTDNQTYVNKHRIN